MQKISKIFLYDEPLVPEIKTEQLAIFLRDVFHIPVEIRENFFKHFAHDDISYKLASARVYNIYTPFERHQPTKEEIQVERTTDKSSDNIILYDGFEIQNILLDCIPEGELGRDIFHLIITTKLGCTYDYSDYRYHGRSVICSNPAIISTTGIIEAPAKPREYYMLLQQKMALGLNLDALKEQFKGRFLEYHDKRLDTIIRGYALQAIFYYITLDPFCQSKECILYNAHWQEDLIHAQTKSGKLCELHKKILEEIRNHA
ncbi:MAG: hypothetical protein KGH76_04940 [Thaumarchaeota archaeon]|nr:hypothetical protein [Nitrososphaerota archaeon]